MVVPLIKPLKKESYFTLVDRMIFSPTEDQLLVTTNFCKKYLINVKDGLLSGNTTAAVEVQGDEKQKIHDSAQFQSCYALATHDGVTVCKWEDIVQGRSGSGKFSEVGTSFYSTNWIGSNVIAGM